jgi:DNA-binding LytR/AlgR family response regulator
MTKQHFFFRQDGLLKKLNLDNVVYMEASKNYTRFCVLEDDVYLIRISLDAAMELLPKNKFLRVHRSFAVSVDHISDVGRESVFFTAFPDLEIPVSRQYYVQLTKQVVILESGSIDQAKAAEKIQPRNESLRPSKNSNRK